MAVLLHGKSSISLHLPKDNTKRQVAEVMRGIILHTPSWCVNVSPQNGLFGVLSLCQGVLTTFSVVTRIVSKTNKVHHPSILAAEEVCTSEALQ